MEADELFALSGAQMGLSIALLHLFNCLHYRGVVSLTEASESLAATEASLPDDAAPATRLVLKALVSGLDGLARGSHEPSPNGPTPVTRPDLRVIQGGQA